MSRVAIFIIAILYGCAGLMTSLKVQDLQEAVQRLEADQ